MAAPLTEKMLVDWAGAQVVREAKSLVDRGLVLEAEHDPPEIRGAILWNNHALRTSLRVLPDGNVESQCPCYANRERGLICNHVIALAWSLVRRMRDPERESKYLAERRRAERLTQFSESDYIQRAGEGTPGALSARIGIVLPADWEEACRRGSVPVGCFALYRQARVPLHDVPRDQALSLDKPAESLLYVLEDIAGGPAKGYMELGLADFINVIRLHAGREIDVENASPLTVNEARLATHLRMDLEVQTGELVLSPHTEVPYQAPDEHPLYIVAGKTGWIHACGNLWPLEKVVPTPYQALYDNPVVLPRTDVIRFLRQELPVLARYLRVESDVSLDLFTVEPAQPSWRLVVSGSPASLSAQLHACYGDIELIAGRPDPRGGFALPDPQDVMCYRSRNLQAEEQALRAAAAAGLPGDRGDTLQSVVGKRNVLNFLASRLPAFRRRGWRVEVHGRVSTWFESLGFATPVVHVRDSGQEGWFDVGFDFEDTVGNSLSQADIQLALRKGDSFLQRSGRTVLIDADAVESMLDVFADCQSREADLPGHFRLADVYSGFVQSSLNSLDGVDVEADTSWLDRASRSNRTMSISSVPLPPDLDRILRPYQKEGVAWLRFLENSGFCGILADEMGLGKTIETLAWLQVERTETEARGKPALIVCPTSLVENWIEEATRFVPELRLLDMTGPHRHERREKIAHADMVVISYAILRRDLSHYIETEFAVVALDEAQHIKNRSTQNAVAAKKLRARHRVVLTGTPIENSVSDLWSIMDFLMPRYLGTHESFRRQYELPIGHGGPEAELAQRKLRRKMGPFLLRRLKTEVAKELPPRIQRVSYCTLSGDQRLVYGELMRSSRKRIRDMVSKRGFNRSRMEILTTLMRLRQVCCHLGLLKLPGLEARYPSAKLELFFELLDEALDGNHRVLVFSQFVSMLSILRKELEQRELTYCYLDGSTRERMQEVRRFNTQREIPLFLISLKAGGTGLNLTGADTVIHFDPWWNPAVEDQATDRAHRIGQKRSVYSIKLIARDTVEESVLALQKRKKAVIASTIESDETALRSLTWDDVQELLSL